MQVRAYLVQLLRQAASNQLRLRPTLLLQLPAATHSAAAPSPPPHAPPQPWLPLPP